MEQVQVSSSDLVESTGIWTMFEGNTVLFTRPLNPYLFYTVYYVQMYRISQ